MWTMAGRPGRLGTSRTAGITGQTRIGSAETQVPQVWTGRQFQGILDRQARNRDRKGHDVIDFEVKISFSNKPAWRTTFMAEDWADAMPQAMEIVEANLTNDDAVTDVKINRLAG